VQLLLDFQRLYPQESKRLLYVAAEKEVRHASRHRVCMCGPMYACVCLRTLAIMRAAGEKRVCPLSPSGHVHQSTRRA
jgi:hypothetical protein